MKIDFSPLQPLMNEMAATLAIFVFGTLIVVTVMAGIMTKLRFPKFIIHPAITFMVLGCLYYWAKYFL